MRVFSEEHGNFQKNTCSNGAHIIEKVLMICCAQSSLTHIVLNNIHFSANTFIVYILLAFAMITHAILSATTSGFSSRHTMCYDIQFRIRLP